MARFIKTKKEFIGSSPDGMTFHGERKSEHVRISVMDYDKDNLTETEVGSIAETLKYAETNTTTWLNIDGLHDAQIMKEISEGFNLSPLIISDILETNSRPKIHEYNDCIYISVKMLQYNEKKHHSTSENLVMIIKKNILISFQERVGDVFNPVRERLRSNRKRFRTAGTDYLAYALLDTIIDNYIYIISLLGEKIENLDKILIDKANDGMLQEISEYKGEIIYMSKIIKPCRELITSLEHIDSDLVHESMQVHLKGLRSNVELANETVEDYREILSDLLSVFHTVMSDKLNDILKTLTIFSVIFIPITFIVGVYGTNFDFMPVLHWRYGYLAMWIMMIVIAISMVIHFKRKKWL